MTKYYDAVLDLSADTSQTRLLRLIGRNKTVLEVGCATGYVSRVLVRDFGCTVTGIEVDPDAARVAATVAQRVIVGDIQTLDYPGTLGDAQFDVVLFADVLEHLVDPEAVLRQVRPFLAEGGRVLASIPNIAHSAIALELLQGRFVYQPRGLLDNTHLRFFTRQSVSQLFEAAGYVISQLDRLHADPSATEFLTRTADLPPEVVRFALQQEEATTYQFIVTAVPATEDARLQELSGARAELDRLQPELTRLQADVSALQAERAEAATLNARLVAAHQAIAAQADRLERLAPFHAETPGAWLRLGLRLTLPGAMYQGVRRAYRRVVGEPPPGPVTAPTGPRGELPRVNGRPLLELLACPACGEARLVEEPAGLACGACRATFPVVRGVPIFLDRPGDYVDRVAQTARTNPYTGASLEIIRRRAAGVVLDLGAGHPKDEEIFPNVLRQEVIHFASTHVVSTTPRLPFRDDVFDAIVCEAVFEHVADPWTAAEEMYRVLKPGGEIRVDSAFLQPFHGDPSHYFNMTVPGIERVFRRFTKLRSGVDVHQRPSFAIRMLLGQYRDFVQDPGLRTQIDQFLALPFEKADEALTPAQHAVVAAGVFFEGTKDPAAS